MAKHTFEFVLDADPDNFDRVIEWAAKEQDCTVSLREGRVRLTFTQEGYDFARAVHQARDKVAGCFEIVEVINEDGTPNLWESCKVSASRLAKKLNYPGWLQSVGVGKSYGVPAIILMCNQEPWRKPDFCEESWETWEVVWKIVGPIGPLGGPS